MNLGTKAIISVLAVMIAIIIVIVLLGYTEGYREWSNTDQLNIDCDTMNYGGGEEGNWTLGYLRNLSAFCSNGGGIE